MKTALFQNCVLSYLRLIPALSRAEKPLLAPPLRRRGHVKPGTELAQVAAVPLAVTAVTQAVPQAQALCLRSLGVAWSPRPDPCAQRDGCSVACGSLLGLRTDR